MPFITKQFANIGTGALGHYGYNQPSPKTFFELEPSSGETNNIGFKASTGSLVGFISLTCQNTIFSRIEYEESQEGCEKFTLYLNALPEFPIQRFTQIQIAIDGEPDYLGYIWEAPQQGETKRKEYKFSGFGLKQRLKTKKIVNPYKSQIAGIAIVGFNIRITFTAPFSIDLAPPIGLRAIVKDCEDSKNNGNGNIVAWDNPGRTWIEILKPNGVAQTIPLGTVSILPDKWSNIHLISDVITYNLQEFATNIPISVNLTKIETTTGKLTTGAIDYDGMTFETFFKKMRSILGTDWQIGVDADGEYFVREINPLILLDKFFTGWQILEPNFKSDDDSIKNIITVLRNKAKTGTGNQLSVAAIASDATSINKFGEFAEEEQIPGFFDDAVATQFANAILAVKKNPVISGSAKNMPYKRYPFGIYGAVTHTDFWRFTLQEFDNLTGWVTGPDITTALTNVALVDGANAQVLSFTDTAEGETHIYTFPTAIKVFSPQNLSFWLRGNKKATYVRFGFGEFAWNDHVWELSVPYLNVYLPQIIDLTAIGTTKIKYIGFQFFNLDVFSYDVFLDKMEIEYYGNIHYKLPLKNRKVVLDNHRNYCDLEFGEQYSNNNLAEFISGIKGLLEVTKMNLKDN